MLGLLGPDRAIGNYILGDKWTILAAANRFEDEPDSNQNQEILNAFYNRFDHMNYAPKFEDWEKWATGKIDKNIVEFVRFFGKNDPDNDVYHGGGKYFYDLDTDRIANTTPRSWESASHALQNCKNSLKKMGTSLEDMSEEDFHETVVNALAKTVGEAAAIDFANFLSLMKHYSVEDANKVFTDPMKAITLRDIKQSVLENDESEVRNKQMTFMLVISMYKAGELLTKDEFTNLFKWMLRPENENDSVVMYFLTTLIKSHPYITTHRYSTAEIEELRKTDKDIDKKIELQQHFLTSPEFKQFSKMYYGVMGK